MQTAIEMLKRGLSKAYEHGIEQVTNATAAFALPMEDVKKLFFACGYNTDSDNGKWRTQVKSWEEFGYVHVDDSRNLVYFIRPDVFTPDEPIIRDCVDAANNWTATHGTRVLGWAE